MLRKKWNKEKERKMKKKRDRERNYDSQNRTIYKTIRTIRTIKTTTIIATQQQ